MKRDRMAVYNSFSANVRERENVSTVIGILLFFRGNFYQVSTFFENCLNFRTKVENFESFEINHKISNENLKNRTSICSNANYYIVYSLCSIIF